MPTTQRRMVHLLLVLLVCFALIRDAHASPRVVERRLVRISYQELLDVFGDGGGATDAATTSEKNNDNNNDNDNPDDRHETEWIARILREQHDKILPLLSKIEEAFGTGGGGETECEASGNRNSNPNSNSNPNNNNNNNNYPLGFLEVTHIPSELAALRERLLPKASELANLPQNELRALERPSTGYSIGWSHGRESFRSNDDDDDGNGGRRYDTAKGSFYLDPFAADNDDNNNINNNNVFPPSLQPQLEADLLEMTHFMAKVGLWIAALCDYYLLLRLGGGEHGSGNRNGNGSGSGGDSCNDNANAEWMVYNSLDSGRSAAKARLLYYFPQSPQPSSTSSSKDPNDDVFDDWCGWHTDHGSLTALLPGLLCDDARSESGPTPGSSATKEDPAPAPSHHHDHHHHRPGLYIQTTRTRSKRGIAEDSGNDADANADDEPVELVRVDLAPDSLGFQLGETLEIMSGGRFKATPHAVKAPTPIENTTVGRASLALFLQPLSSQVLPPLPGANDECSANANASGAPLSLHRRWRGTFGEFQKTTVESFS